MCPHVGLSPFNRPFHVCGYKGFKLRCRAKERYDTGRSRKLHLVAACAALLVLLFGCAEIGRYAYDRALDLTDIVDFKHISRWDSGSWAGLGARVEATDYLGVGFGLAPNYFVTEWYGR